VAGRARGSDGRVRFQVALSPAAKRAPEIVFPLADVARIDHSDRFTRAAVISSSAGFTDYLMRLRITSLSVGLLGEKPLPADDPVRVFSEAALADQGFVDTIRLMAATAGAGESLEQCGSVLTKVVQSRSSARAWK